MPVLWGLVAAKVPNAANGTPFGPRIHAVATYLKTFQALSYERLQRAFADLFGSCPKAWCSSWLRTTLSGKAGLISVPLLTD